MTAGPHGERRSRRKAPPKDADLAAMEVAQRADQDFVTLILSHVPYSRFVMGGEDKDPLTVKDFFDLRTLAANELFFGRPIHELESVLKRDIGRLLTHPRFAEVRDALRGKAVELSGASGIASLNGMVEGQVALTIASAALNSTDQRSKMTAAMAIMDRLAPKATRQPKESDASGMRAFPDDMVKIMEWALTSGVKFGRALPAETPVLEIDASVLNVPVKLIGSGETEG